jgi:hypothetical protein
MKAFNTLCEALSLSSAELETMNYYKRTKLQWEAGEKKEKPEKKSIENRFMDFLTSD